jgi:hypothetical protein
LTRRQLQPWAEARHAAEGSYAADLSDLHVLWCHAEEVRDLVLGFRCALIATSIRSLSGNLSPELLVGLVIVGTPEGKWSVEAALEHIRQMPDPQMQVKALLALVECGCDLPGGLALEIAETIANERMRASVFIAIIHRLSDTLSVDIYIQILAVARAFRQALPYARVLIALMPYLPVEYCGGICHDILHCVNGIVYLPERVRIMASVVPYLHGDQQNNLCTRILNVLPVIRDENLSSEIFR